LTQNGRSFTVNDPTQAQRAARPFYGWINAFLLSLIFMATAGFVFYPFSVIFPVMLKTTGWSRGDASIAVSVATLVGGFLIPLAAKLLNTFGSRKVIILGLAILLSSLVLLGTVMTKLWHWTLIWGVIMPIGSLLSGPLPSQVNIMYWFNRKRAMAMGLLMTGAPIGGLFAPPLYTWIMTHMGGWRTGWLLSAGIVFLALIVSFFIKSKPSDMGQFPDGIPPGAVSDNGENKPPEPSPIFRTKFVWTLREVLKTRTIWLLTLANIAQGLTLGIIVNHGVLHLTDVGFSNMNAAFILSAIIMSSGIIRLPVGWLGDRVEPRWIYCVAIFLMLAGFVGFWKAPSFAFLMVLGPIYGIAYGALLTIAPTLAGNYYGPEVFPSIRGFFGPPVTLLSAAIPTVAGYAVEKMGSYNEIFLALSILLLLGGVCSAFLSPPNK
jgi:MFS family permease